MSQLENFKLQLEELKKQGVDIDPEKVTQEIVQTPVELQKMKQEEREEKLFVLVKEKIDSLLHDYFSHYRPKGRKLRVAVEIAKENCADKYGEKFIYSDKFEVISVIGIGTKGKYEK
jgi:hypothetical protein